MPNAMKRNDFKMVLFASLIAAMILPFSNMNVVDAQAGNESVIGKNIIKDQVSYKSMPTIEDVKTELKESGLTKEEIDEMDVSQLHYDKHQDWLSEHKDVQKEQIVREKQILLTETVIEKFQSADSTQKNYFPWTSIGYDYQDNALEVTMEPSELSVVNTQKYIDMIRQIVGDEIDITISPMENELEQVYCNNRSHCPDLKAGVEIGIQGKDFPCTLGFPATNEGQAGFVTAGHCFDGLPVGSNAYHPQRGVHIGDLVSEHANGSEHGLVCDCAFVASTPTYPVGEGTFGLQSATTTGASTDDKQIKASLGQYNRVSSGVILDASRSFHQDPKLIDERNQYHYLYVVLTDIRAINGDSGSPVFGDNGREFLGILVARHPEGSIYVKEYLFRLIYPGLTWNF